MGHSGRSITFQAGPFRGWSFTVDACRDDAGTSTGRVQVGIETAPSDGRRGRLHGHVAFREGMPGYAEMIAALDGHGRPALEAALAWVLDATDVALDQPGHDRDRWDHWTRIVGKGETARASYQAAWGDGPGPAFEVVYASSGVFA
jgi:hypothetical protein